MPVDFLALLSVLASTRVRFVVVGDLAMVLQGVDRLTADADVVIDLTSDALGEAIQALIDSGYRPLAPVDPLQFADPAQRALWQQHKGMQVFSFWDSTSARPTVDVLLESPVPFEELWAEATRFDMGGLTVAVASREHLIRMKEAAGRERDRVDITRLREID